MLRLVRWLVVLPIRMYQRLVSPILGPRCKYYPCCSEYARQSVLNIGLIRSIPLIVWRLARCNPWSLGGVDHPPGTPMPPTALPTP